MKKKALFWILALSLQQTGAFADPLCTPAAVSVSEEGTQTIAGGWHFQNDSWYFTI